VLLPRGRHLVAVGVEGAGVEGLDVVEGVGVVEMVEEGVGVARDVVKGEEGVVVVTAAVMTAVAVVGTGEIRNRSRQQRYCPVGW
jgi:hypothetical protein